jgi:hypothetical protein
MSTLFSDTATDSISSSRIRDCSSGYKTGGWIGVRHPLRGGWMLANRGLDLARSGARHLLWGGRMLANRGLDRCQAPAVGRMDASKLGV